MAQAETLRKLLIDHYRDLQIVLASAMAARKFANSLDPGIANAQVGPFERTLWLDNAIKDLGSGGPVRVQKYDERRNWLEVLVQDAEHQRWLKFAPYFAVQLSDGVSYEIHAKGKETRGNEPLQYVHEEFKTEQEKPSEMFGYALRTFKVIDGQPLVPELHIVLGSEPRKVGIMKERVKSYDRLIVRIDDNPQDLVEPYVAPFDPQGAI